MIKLADFLKELYSRFPLKTPKFFQVFQFIGILSIVVGGIPDVLHWLEITPSPLFSKVLTKCLEACGAITWAMAKLPVEHATTIATKTDMLPFTTAAKQEAATKLTEDNIL